MSGDRVEVKILSFGIVREILQKDDETIVLRPNWTNSEELKDFLCEKHFPQLKEQKDSLVLALNEEFLFNSGGITLNRMDTIALIPPITGG